jgi:hypothetical protein
MAGTLYAPTRAVSLFRVRPKDSQRFPQKALDYPKRLGYSLYMETKTPTQTEVTLYVSKLFTAGILKGLTVQDTIKFSDSAKAWNWAKEHKTVPVKSTGGSRYLISDASFQSFSR